MENNKENTCSCGCCAGHGSCGSGCRSINHHSVIRILVGIIVLMVVFFAGFKTGFFFGNIMDGNYGSRGGYSRMMNRDFDGYRQQMMLYKQTAPVSTTTTK